MPSEPITVWREPWSATTRRLGIRAAIAIAGVLIAGIPGVWGGLLPWTPLRWIGGALALVGLLYIGLSFANLALNHQALLVLSPEGRLERPPSLQERLLKRPVEGVSGADVAVTDAIAAVVPSRADPRVTLAAGDERVADVPLWGTDLDAFIAQANTTLEGRGMALRYVPPPRAEDDAAD